MEIYVTGKENILSSNDGVITELIIPNNNVEIKSLEQHDAEVKKQEREKVIAEMEGYVNDCKYETTASVGGFDYYVNDTEDLNQKLNEMKEVRDEN